MIRPYAHGVIPNTSGNRDRMAHNLTLAAVARLAGLLSTARALLYSARALRLNARGEW